MAVTWLGEHALAPTILLPPLSAISVQEIRNRMPMSPAARSAMFATTLLSPSADVKSALDVAVDRRKADKARRAEMLDLLRKVCVRERESGSVCVSGCASVYVCL